MPISLTGSLNLSGSNTLIGTKTITGSVFISGSKTIIGTTSITGSLLVTGSLTTVGTITATTLVVQTITSSISSITGSTNFGSLSSNNHVFTGSMYVTGAFYVSTGSVGIGTVSPSQKLEVVGGEIKAGRVDTNQEGGQVSFGRASDNNTSWYIDLYGSSTSPQLRFVDVDNSAVRMTMTGSNVGIGTSSPNARLSLGTGTGTKFLLYDGGFTGSGGNGYFAGFAIDSPSANDTTLLAHYQGALVFGRYTNANDTSAVTERMRITSGGSVGIGTSSPTYTLHVMGSVYSRYDANTNAAINAVNQSSAGSRCYYGQKYNGSTDDYYMVFDNNVANKFLFYGNGGLGNVQANNANISDRRTKKDIISLESYWNKFKAIEIVKFKYIDQDHDDYNIGLIAQQLEEIAPEFIDSDGWGKNTPMETEVPLKTVYTTDLYHATIKVLQEAMTKIETLEARVQYLENK